jgi:hypothetical protein
MHKKLAQSPILPLSSSEVKEKAKVYLGKLKDTNPEKLKEYRHTAYLNRKAKLQEQKNKEDKNFIPTMGKGLRKLIHRKYDTITVNECRTVVIVCQL